MRTVYVITYKEMLERDAWKLHAVFYAAENAEEVRKAFERPDVKVLSVVRADKENDLLVDGQIM